MSLISESARVLANDRLEDLGRDGSPSEAEPVYTELEKEIQRLKSVLANLGELMVRP